MAPGPSIFMNEKTKSQAIRLNCNIMNLNNLDFFLVDALKINFCRAFSSHKSQIPLFCFCFHLCKTVMMLFLESRSNAKKPQELKGLPACAEFFLQWLRNLEIFLSTFPCTVSDFPSPQTFLAVDATHF